MRQLNRRHQHNDINIKRKVEPIFAKGYLDNKPFFQELLLFYQGIGKRVKEYVEICLIEVLMMNP